ncbi:hypothetical protein [Halococcus agarilyticus]|uniref:hypothetical protein n=1 Tax=Halococcus agarilyticus TaxID=1232219 RepID=UPI0012AB8875|nr:hypothetical protein [Halococcus agarilyticus]
MSTNATTRGSLASEATRAAEQWNPEYQRWYQPSRRLKTDLTRSDGTQQQWSEDVLDLLTEYAGESANPAYSNGLQSKANRRYAQILDQDRYVQRQYDDYSIALFTLGGQFLTSTNEFCDPVQFRRELLESRHTVAQKMYQVMNRCDGISYCTVVSGNGAKGYSHVHVLAYLQGEIEPSDLQPVLDAHVEESPVARSIYHHAEQVVSVRHSSELVHEPQGQRDHERGTPSAAARYVASQVPHVGGEEAPLPMIEHAAVCRQTQSQDVTTSATFDANAEAEYVARETVLDEMDHYQRKLNSRVKTPVSVSDSSSASSGETDLVRFKSNLVPLDTNQVCTNMNGLRLDPNLALLVWLYRPPG